MKNYIGPLYYSLLKGLISFLTFLWRLFQFILLLTFGAYVIQNEEKILQMITENIYRETRKIGCFFKESQHILYTISEYDELKIISKENLGKSAYFEYSKLYEP